MNRLEELKLQSLVKQGFTSDGALLVLASQKNNENFNIDIIERIREENQILYDFITKPNEGDYGLSNIQSSHQSLRKDN